MLSIRIFLVVILSGHNISQILRNYKNDFGNVKVTGRKRKIIEPVGSESDDESSESEEEEEAVDEEELSRWKKRSIFFKLPYWEVCFLYSYLSTLFINVLSLAFFDTLMCVCSV